MDASLHHDPATLWAPKRQLTLAQARRRSERVRYLRYGLVGAAAVSIGLFLGFVFRSAVSQDARPPAVRDDEAVTMINPRFTGRDSEGQVFTITADAAQRRRPAHVVRREPVAPQDEHEDRGAAPGSAGGERRWRETLQAAFANPADFRIIQQGENSLAIGGAMQRKARADR